MKSKYSLTPEQEKAFASLERAIRKCKAAGIYLWDNYGTISAVDGRRLNSISTNPRDGEPIDYAQVSTIPVSAKSGCWHGSNSDDDLFVER